MVLRMETPTYQTLIARRVGNAIEAAGLTVLGVAEATAIPRTTLIRRLNGVQPFTTNEIKAIADLLAIPVSTLVAEDAA